MTTINALWIVVQTILLVWILFGLIVLFNKVVWKMLDRFFS